MDDIPVFTQKQVDDMFEKHRANLEYLEELIRKIRVRFLCGFEIKDLLETATDEIERIKEEVPSTKPNDTSNNEII